MSQDNAELAAARVASDAGPPSPVMVAVDRLSRTFGSGHTAVHALREVSFTVARGRLTALRGRSGSGKTTLLNIIGGLDSPTEGQVWVDGREVSRPTGELDSSTAHEVFAALQTANSELAVTVLVVTHDPAVSSQVRRTIAIRDGRISSETIRHAATDEHGQTALHAREYATLDRAGRIQLPRDMIRRLRMRDRVELQEEPDHIGVWPDQATDQPPHQ